MPDPEGRFNTISYVSGLAVTGQKVGTRIPLEGSLVQKTFASRSGALIQDVDRRYLEEHVGASLPFYDAGLRSFLTLPLLHQGNAVAVLAIAPRAESAFTDSHVNLAERIAEQIAGAIANSRLHATLETEAEERRTLAEIGWIISSSLDIDEVYEQFAIQLRHLIPVDRLNIFTPDAERRFNTISYLWGLVSGGEMVGTRIPLEGSLVQKTFASRSCTLIQGVDREYLEEHFDALLVHYDGGYRSFLTLPLFHQGNPVAVMAIGSRTENAFTDGHVDLAEQVALQIAGAIANSILYAERSNLQNQLSQSQKMEAIGRLAGGIAHDFNNLLTPIITYSNMGASKVEPTDAVHGYLREIGKAGQRGDELTRQFLAFSRHQVIELKVLDLNQLIFDVDSMLRRLIGENVELVFLPAHDLSLVYLDSGQVEQVLINLIVNARDAMPGGGKIIIETENVSLDDRSAASVPAAAGSEYVTVSVRDTGTGIADEIKEHIFEPFFTTKEPGKGTGLGLSMSYGVVSQLGGRITVDDGPEGGALFRIFLPKAKRAESPKGAATGRDSFLTGSETILVVEDEVSVLRVVVEALRDHGYAVLEAANGNEALSAIHGYSDGNVDLVVTDVVMPLMGGQGPGGSPFKDPSGDEGIVHVRVCGRPTWR